MNKMDQNNPSASQTKMGVLAIEKRKHPRFSVELPLDYARVNGKETYGGMVANASEGGLLVYLPERIEIGSLLKIEIFSLFYPFRFCFIKLSFFWNLFVQHVFGFVNLNFILVHFALDLVSFYPEISPLGRAL